MVSDQGRKHHSLRRMELVDQYNDFLRNRSFNKISSDVVVAFAAGVTRLPE